MGPLPLAFAAISARALASVMASAHRSCFSFGGKRDYARAQGDEPARCFSWKAISSSSSSLVAFLGAFKGFTLPPGRGREDGQSVGHVQRGGSFEQRRGALGMFGDVPSLFWPPIMKDGSQG